MVTSKPLPAQAARYLSKVEVNERLFELLFEALDAENRKVFDSLTRTEKMKLLYTLGAEEGLETRG